MEQLETANHKLKQLKEAENLLDDLSWRISWALDFSEYETINEELSPALESVDEALTNIQDQIETLEESIEHYKADKERIVCEYDSYESNLKHLLA